MSSSVDPPCQPRRSWCRFLFASALALLAAPACTDTADTADPPGTRAAGLVACEHPAYAGDVYGGETYGCDDVPVCAVDETGAPDCADPDCAGAPACTSDGECPLDEEGYPDCLDPDCAGAANCDDDGVCSEDPDGTPDCEDPDCAGAPACVPDGECGTAGDGSADCDDPDCASDPACDQHCEEAEDGSVDCADPDCEGEPACGSDGECRVDETGASNCEDPDCAEAPDCTGDGECGETAEGGPDCDDPDCGGEAECEPDDVCETDESGVINCDDPDCAGQDACESDGTCDPVGDVTPTPTPAPGPGSMARDFTIPGPGGPDCEDPDCDEEVECAPPEPPTKRITFPELIAVQHIRTFNVNDYLDELLAVDPWLGVIGAGGAGATELVVVLRGMLKGLQMTANPESPWHLLSNGLEKIDGAWRRGKALNEYWRSKEYRSWLQQTATTGGWWPQIKCKDGKLLAAFDGRKLNGSVSHSHGWTPDPLHVTYTAGEPKTGSPWHSYTVNAANDALTWNAHLESRISRAARVVSFNILGYDAPFIYSKLKYTLRCDGTYSVEADASSFPTVTLYVNRRAHSWRGQRGIAAFLKSGSAGRLDANGAGPTAPGAVYARFNGQGDIVDE